MKKWMIFGVVFLLLLTVGLDARIDRPVTLRFKNADIRTVIETFADLGGVNIVVSENVKGTISLNLRKVSWDDAFKTVLQVHGLASVEEEGMIGVMTMEEFEARRKMVDLETNVFRIKYADAQGIMGVVEKMLSERGGINVDTRTNSIIVTDVPSNIPKLEALIDIVDTPTPQVMIEARIVEVDHKVLREMGIRWQAENVNVPTQDTHFGAKVNVGLEGAPFSFTFGTLQAGIDIDGMLGLLESKDKARILSEPRVAVADNEEAMILSGKKVPVITLDFAGNQIVRFYDVAIKLTVRPHINPKNEIVMELHPEVSDLSSEATVQGGIIMLSSEVITKLRVRDGETAVIGGIVKTRESTVERGIPILSSIPLLGRLFKYKSTSKDNVEIMIFVTPRIIPVLEE
ncbi:MAG: type IV pilus secretin PilQ [bacterium]|nr:type IV pilus secretin PilQ [bacterium]